MIGGIRQIPPKADNITTYWNSNEIPASKDTEITNIQPVRVVARGSYKLGRHVRIIGFLIWCTATFSCSNWAKNRAVFGPGTRASGSRIGQQHQDPVENGDPAMYSWRQILSMNQNIRTN